MLGCTVVGMGVFNRLAAARKLPPGHYDLAKAEKAVAAIYARCQKQESKWWDKKKKSVRKRFSNFDHAEAVEFCNYICDSIGQRRIRKLVFHSPDVHSEAGGHWCRNEIHLKRGWCTPRFLIHELTHHCGAMDHGDEFCELELLLFEVADQYFKVKMYGG